MDDRQKYDLLVERINNLLKKEDFYDNFRRKLKAAKPSVKLAKKSRAKTFDLEWVEMIEGALPNLDNIVRNPRKFIVIEEDIVDISLARSISTESVKHLAQHTNLIAAVDKDGNVTPNKILNTSKEESYEIYENRFIYTLLRNLANFINRRMDAVHQAYVNDNVLELDVNTSLFTGKTRVFYSLELIGALPIDEVKDMKSEELSVVERIAKLQRIVNDFLGSAFAKQMVNSAPVRPPIQRTNVILKNPDFKKALVLWQFVESYAKMGFAVENVVSNVAVDAKLDDGVSDMVCLGTMLMEGLIEGKVEDTGFFDESNMDETNLGGEDRTEEEKPEEEKSEEEKSEEESPEVEEAVDEEKLPEEEEEKDEDEEEQEPEEEISEMRNLFQRTNEENKLSKAEIARMNKAIDRVLLREKEINASARVEAEAPKEKKEVDKQALLDRLARQREVAQRSLERRAKLAEREKAAAERDMLREQRRLERLEGELNKQREEAEAAQNAEQSEDGAASDLNNTATGAETSVQNVETTSKSEEAVTENVETPSENAETKSDSVETTPEAVETPSENAETVTQESEKIAENAERTDENVEITETSSQVNEADATGISDEKPSEGEARTEDDVPENNG